MEPFDRSTRGVYVRFNCITDGRTNGHSLCFILAYPLPKNTSDSIFLNKTQIESPCLHRNGFCSHTCTFEYRGPHEESKPVCSCPNRHELGSFLRIFATINIIESKKFGLKKKKDMEKRHLVVAYFAPDRVINVGWIFALKRKHSSWVTQQSLNSIRNVS